MTEPKYRLNQHVFLMDKNTPKMKKIICVSQIEDGNYYVLDSDKTGTLSSYKAFLSESKPKYVDEKKLFNTLEDLQKSLFGDIK